MRAMKLCVLGLVFGSASLAAQPEFMVAQASMAPAAGESASLLEQIQQADHLLFFRIPAAALPAAKRSFVIRINLDGRPFTEETYRLEAGTSGPLTVEILGLAPPLLERAYQKANQHAMTVTVMAGGKVFRELAWDELLDHSRQLRKGDFRPMAVRSEVKSFFSPWPPPKPAVQSSQPSSPAKYYGPEHYCAEQCDDAYYRCYYEDCDQRGSCAYCGDWYTSCINSCPIICEDPKKVEDLTTKQIVGSQFTGFGGCYTAWKAPSGKYNFMQYQLTIKSTTTRKTTYCDGSTYTEYLGDSYSYTYCYVRGGTCSFSSGTMFNEC